MSHDADPRPTRQGQDSSLSTTIQEGLKIKQLPTEARVKERLSDLVDQSKRDHFQHVRNLLSSARQSAPSTLQGRHHPPGSPFARIQNNENAAQHPVQYSFSFYKCTASKSIVRAGSSTKNFNAISCPRNEQANPPYTDYTTLKDNILGRNERELRAWPQVSDPDIQDELEKSLEDYFKDRNPNTRFWQLPDRVELRQLWPYLKKLLDSYKISSNDILSYLLQSKAQLRRKITKTHWKIVEDRNGFCAVEPDRTSMPTVQKVSTLPEPSVLNLLIAHMICVAITDLCQIRVWPALESITPYSQVQVGNSDPSRLLTFWDVQEAFQCRICYMTDCLFHGEYTEESETNRGISGIIPSPLNDESNHRLRVTGRVSLKRKRKFPSDTFAKMITPSIGQADDGAVAYGDSVNDGQESTYSDSALCSESCFWKISNREKADEAHWSDEELEALERLLSQYAVYKRGPCLMAACLTQSCTQVYKQAIEMISARPIEDEQHEPSCKKQPHEGRKAASLDQAGATKVASLQNSAALHKRPFFYPCDHDGPCSSAKNCSCWEAKVHCEKHCRCASQCERKFQGCGCLQSNGACWSDERCACWTANRECDPDLCSSCGCKELLDPVQHIDDHARKGCGNVGLQRNVPKYTVLGKSQVAGFGLYAGEVIHENDFVGEYKGEIVSEAETNRRGEPYHYAENLYFFTLGKDSSSDGYRLSNKIRFINHSSDPTHQNCYVKLMLCNTVIRVGLYALREIQPGEELFFDYRYGTEYLQERGYVEKSGKKSATRAIDTGHKPKDAKFTKALRSSTGGVPLAIAKNADEEFVMPTAISSRQTKPRNSELNEENPVHLPIPPWYDDANDGDYQEQRSEISETSEEADADQQRHGMVTRGNTNSLPERSRRQTNHATKRS